MSLLVVGCTVVDVIFPRVTRLPRWPDHTEFTGRNLSLLESPPIVTLGGNGATCAYIAAGLGEEVRLHTQIGCDYFGNLARAWLERPGVRITSGNARATAINVTAANERSQRATLFYPGAPVKIPLGQESTQFLLVCGWPHPSLGLVGKRFRAARESGTFTVLDAGPILDRPWSLPGLALVFPHLDLLLANEYEILRVARRQKLTDALGTLRKKFVGHVVIKRGARGACWLPAGSDRAEDFAAEKIKVVNTVGAGDSFNGALLAALSRERDFPRAILAATAMAARVVASGYGVLGAFRRP